MRGYLLESLREISSRRMYSITGALQFADWGRARCPIRCGGVRGRFG